MKRSLIALGGFAIYAALMITLANMSGLWLCLALIISLSGFSAFVLYASRQSDVDDEDDF